MEPGGSFVVWCALMFVVWIAVILVPVWKIVSRAGFSGFWALLALVPLANLVALWLFAFASWPAAPRATR
jgi:hypothetical protein